MKIIKSLVAIIFAASMFVACSGGSGNPQAAAEGFGKAVQNLDFDAAKKYATKESAVVIDGMKGMYSQLTDEQIEQAKKATEGVKIEYTGSEISEDGNTATVTVKTTMPDGSTHDSKQHLVKEDGEWKVQFKM